jgi:carbonic anhydrase
MALAWAPAHAARWLPVTESSIRAVYLDTAGAARDGTYVRAWVREVYTNEQRSDQVGVMYYSANTLTSYDCARRTSSSLFRVFYGGDGTELRRVAMDAVDLPTLASPGSLQEALLERACSALIKPKKDESVPDQLVKVAAAEDSIKPTAVSASKERAKAEVEKASDQAAGPGKPQAAEAKKPEGEPAKPEAAQGHKPEAAAEKPDAPAEKPKAAAATKAAAKEVHAALVPAKPKDAIKPVRLPAVAQTVPRTLATPARYALYEPPRRPKPVRAGAKHDARQPTADAGSEPKTEAKQEHEVHWSYTGPNGAENWGKLKPEFAACAAGKRQSPIDIRDGAKLELEPIRFDYKPSPLRIVDNGHTVQVNYAEGSTIVVAGERFELTQFHFHKPSEERINGKLYDMVAHLVHRSTDGRLAVVAVLFESGPFQNTFVKGLWPHLPLEAGREIAPLDVTIDVNDILPAQRTYYTFMGSLTTPPCTEGVLWLVMKNPVPITAEQVGVFGKLYAMNARPGQPGNARLIKESM